MATKFGWVDGKPGIAATLPVSDGMRSLSGSLQESGDVADRRITDLEIAWQGTASDAARRSLTATSSGMADTAVVTGNGAERLVDHGHSFETMRRQIAYVDPADHSWFQRAVDNSAEAWHSLWGNGADHVTIGERNLANDEIANRALDRYAAETTATDDSFAGAVPPPPAGAAAGPHGGGGGMPATGPGIPAVSPPVTGPAGPATETPAVPGPTGPPSGPGSSGPGSGDTGSGDTGGSGRGLPGPGPLDPPVGPRSDTVDQAEAVPGPSERLPPPGPQQVPDRAWTADRPSTPFAPPYGAALPGPDGARSRDQLTRDFADRARRHQLVPGPGRVPGGTEPHPPTGAGRWRMEPTRRPDRPGRSRPPGPAGGCPRFRRPRRLRPDGGRGRRRRRRGRAGPPQPLRRPHRRGVRHRRDGHRRRPRARRGPPVTGRTPGPGAPGPALDWRRATVLGAAEFDVARDLLDLGRGPAVLGLLSPGPTDVERAGVVRDATRSLGARGLLDAGGFRPALVDDLRTVVAPEFQLDLVVAPPTAQHALVGHRSGRAVLATRIGDDVALLRVRPEHAAAALVELLGPIAPGPGPTVRIPVRVLADAVAAVDGDRPRWVPELLRRGCSGAEAELVRRMGEIQGLAQLGAGRAGPVGCRASAVLLVHVTAHGCYYQRRPAPGVVGGPIPDGATVHAGPVDAATLVAELAALLR